MTRVVRHYPAIVEGDAESGYGVFFPDLPGCTSGGETIQEAALNASEALVGHLGLMLEGGDPLPEPGRLDDLDRSVDPDVIEAARILVPVDIGSKAVRLRSVSTRTSCATSTAPPPPPASRARPSSPRPRAGC